MSVYSPRCIGFVTIVIKRFAARTVGAGGGFIRGAALPDTPIDVSLQPLDGDELQVLPEAERVKRTKKIYSGSEIREASVKDGTEADEFTFEGFVFKVFSVEKYSMGVLDHFKAICIAVEV